MPEPEAIETEQVPWLPTILAVSTLIGHEPPLPIYRSSQGHYMTWLNDGLTCISPDGQSIVYEDLNRCFYQHKLERWTPCILADVEPDDPDLGAVLHLAEFQELVFQLNNNA